MFINNKLLGAVLMVTSTCVGASMISLPMVSMLIGTSNTLLLLVVIWALAYNASVINTDISLFYQGSFSISKLCQKSFSYHRIWILLDALIIILFYTLLSAYMSAIISISEVLLENNNFLIDTKLFGYTAIVILLLLIVINFRILDISNKFIFFITLIIFMIIIYIIFSKTALSNLRKMQCCIVINDNFFKAIPVFFTSFGFHGSIPFIIKYLNYDKQYIKKAFFWGSFISFIIYLSWTFLTLSTFTTSSMEYFNTIKNRNLHINNFIHVLVEATSQNSLNYLIIVFTWLTILTSFLGVGVGLYDYFLEKLRLNSLLFVDTLKVSLVTFFPPFLIACLGKDIFLDALAAAAIILVLLAIIFPCLVALKIKTGKKVNVIISLALGLLIVAVEIYNFLL